MIKSFIFILLISTSLCAQDFTERELAFVENTEQAENYLTTNNKKGNKFIVFNEEKHKTALAKDLFELGKTGVKVVRTEYQKTYYKIIDKTEIPHYRASYIFLDGNKLDASEINKLQQTIIAKFNRGMSFNDLAKQYSMDDNANKGGDLGWFTLGEIHPIFEDEIVNNNQNLGDIFTLEIASKQWHYIILKTHKPKQIAEIKVLKIVELIN